MDKITLANALKAVFGTSITPTSSQYVPITAADGTPAGISSMSALASVLGGIQIMNVMESGTISQIDKTCVYIVANNTYTPSDIPAAFVNSIVLTIKASGSQNPTLQVIISAAGLDMKIRTRWFGDWNDWRALTLS